MVVIKNAVKAMESMISPDRVRSARRSADSDLRKGEDANPPGPTVRRADDRADTGLDPDHYLGFTLNKG